MIVLVLGPRTDAIASVVIAGGDEVIQRDSPLAPGERFDGTDFLVSFGYRHIIKPDVLEQFQGRAINIHISLLPWNRGADPNLWSFLEDSPKGVTIHVIDEGLDTGPILAQEEVRPSPDDTLKTSYERLIERAIALFSMEWPALRDGRVVPRRQVGEGSRHSSRDKARFEKLMPKGWETPITELIGRAKASRA